MLHSGQRISAAYSGKSRAQQALQQGQVKPLSMATEDFDRDGVADLVVGYASSTGGVLSLHRGNLDAFAPQSQASWTAIAQSRFPSPFLRQAQAIEVPVSPDFLVAGDFDGDGAPDVLVGARGGNALYLLAGDGHGNFAKPQSLPLPGALTALADGHVGGSQASQDVAVGIATPQGSQLLLYRAQAGALTQVASYALPSPATAFAFGHLEGDPVPDLAIVSGGKVLVLHGSDVPSGASAGAAQLIPAQLATLPLSVSVSGIALGTFISNRSGWTQMALSSPDGSVSIAVPGELDTRPYTPEEARARRVKGMTNARARREALSQGLADPLERTAPIGSQGWRVVEYFPPVGSSGAATQTPIVRTQVSGSPSHDIAVMDSSGHQIHVLSHPAQTAAATSSAMTHTALPVNAAGSIVAVLPMRVSIDGRPGMVVLSDGQVTPTVMMPLPDPTYTVNITSDPVSTVAAAATYCNGVAGDCSLRQAVIKANSVSGCDIIMVPAGTYTLTVPATGSPNGPHDSTAGRLDIQDCVSIVGATSGGLPASIVQAGTTTSNGVDKVFSVNPDFDKAFVTSFSNLEIRFGLNKYPFYSDAFAGDGFGAGIDWEADGTGTLSVTNCNIHDNTAIDGGGAGLFLTNSVSEVGGATVSGSTIANNTANSSVSGEGAEGGGIFSGGTGSDGAGVTPVAISNTTVSGNRATNAGTAASIGGGLGEDTGGNGNPYAINFTNSIISGNSASLDGGGVYVTAPISIDLSTISNNTAGRFGGGVYTHACGSGVGCAAGSPNGTTITHSNITGNNAAAADGGGGVFQDGGGAAATLHFNRIFGNKVGGSTGVSGTGVVSNQGASGGNPASIATADHNWWGCNADPASGTGCDKITATNGGTETHSPWIVLTLAASPTTLQPQPPGTTSSTLTADFLHASDNTAIAASNLGAFTGLDGPTTAHSPAALSITFGATNGTISGAQSTIQSTGTATATVTPNTSCQNITASATVDNATPTTNITVLCPDLTATKTNSLGVSGVTTPLSSPSWTWTIVVGNSPATNSTSALFTNGETILTDNLPGSNISYSNLVFPGVPNASCSITSNLLTCSASGGDVTIGRAGELLLSFTATATAAGSYVNPTSGICAVDPNNDVIEFNESNNSCSNTVIVVAPPSISKSFLTNPIAVGGTTSLQFTITNPSANTVGLTGVGFTDTLPAGLAVADSTSTPCGGSLTTTAATRQIALSGATIATGGQCVFSVTVTGATAGSYNNTTQAVTSTNGGTGNTASAPLVVLSPPTITKAFGTHPSIPLNGTTSLTFTITNPNSFASLTGLGFTDNLPGGLAVTGAATNNGCGGTASTNTSTVSLSGGTLAASGSCTIVVTVKGTTAGLQTNNVTVTSAVGGNTSTDSLTVVAPPVVSKAFSPSTIPLGNVSTLTFTVTNPNSFASLSGISFGDLLPSNLVVATPNGVAGSCSPGTINATAGSNLIQLAGTGGTLSGGSSCTFSVNVTATSAGTYPNIANPPTSNEGGAGASSNTATLTVVNPVCFAPPANMVSWWPGENNANDVVGGNNGTAHSAVTFAAGEVGQAFQFDGTSNSFIDIGNPASLSIPGAITVDAWVYNVPDGNSHVIFSQMSNSNSLGEVALRISPSGQLQWFRRPTASSINVDLVTSNAFVAANAWQHVVGVYDGSTYKVYVNGVADTATATTATYTGSAGPDNIIGQAEAGSDRFNGLIDEVEIFNAALSQTDIQSIYQAGSAGKCKSNAGFSKAFNPTSIASGGTSTLTFTITNPNTEVNLTGVSFTDNFPSGLTTATPVTTSSTCGGGVTVGTTTFGFNGGTVPAGGSCTVSVNVTSTTPGNANNTSGNISTNEAGTGGTASATLNVVAPPDLTITKSHTGNFTQGQTGAQYTITVTNSGGTSTSGTVSVSDTVPSGLTATAISGTGWTCTPPSGPCTRGDALAATANYPALTLTVNVANNAPSSVTNSATVSGGGEVNTGNDTASDPTTVNAGPDLTITKSHTGNFFQGQTGAQYTITVTNSGGTPTSGTVSVGDTVPSGLTATAISGTGWTCTPPSGPCTRSDALAATNSYPAITLTVNVASNAPSSVTNSATVSGGGEVNTGNDTASDPTTVNAGPDLTITKSHTGNFTQGQTGAQYTITVTNSGGTPTSGTVSVSDTVPSGLTATSISGTGWTCTPPSGPCTRSDALAATANYPALTLTVNVSATAPTSVTNSATVSGGGEVNTGNDTANDPTTVNSGPDLTITKTHTGNFFQGQTGAQYTITVTNSGSAATSGTVSVSDTLPTGLTATAISGTGWTCTPPSGPCTRSDALAATANYPALTLTVNVANNAPSSVTNSATVSGGGEVNTGNDTASDPTTVNAGPDLTITKSHTGNFFQGQTGAQYTITATNSGGTPTSGTVSVSDTVPSGLTATAISGTGWTCTQPSGPCTRSDALAATANYPALTLTVNVSATAPTSVTNTATVSGGGEVNTGNNTANDPTTVNAGPDLTITKSHTGNFTQGQTGAQYTITVTNSGNTPTSGTVSVSDTVPSGLTATSISGTGWTCTQPSGPCTRSDALAATNSYPALTLTVNVTNNAPSSVTNKATVSGGGEVNTGNDTANDPTTIIAGPDLTITKSHTGNFTQGQAGAQYTITVTNSGGTPTSGTVSVSDTVPSGLTATAISGTGWTCTQPSGPCTRSDALAATNSYAALTLTVNVANNAPTSVTNTATVSGGGEVNTGNDTANDPTTIIAGPDLTITKSHTGNFTRGQTGAQYTITVTNSGGTPTSGTVSVSDTVPSGLTATAISGTGWTCTQPSGPCTRSDALATTAHYPALTLTVNVSATAPASVTNTATVSGGGEVNTGNDTASDPTTINGGPDLTITKTHSGNFTQGQTGAQYTITVKNAGTASTTGTVTVTDTVPAGLTATSISGTGWSCTQPSGPCTRSDALAAGLNYPSLTLKVNVASNAPASVTNSATVSGGGESNTSNDTATDPTTIEPAFAIDIAVWKDQGTAATTVTSPTFSTHAANETLLVFISTDAIDSISNKVNSVSGGGLTWTLVKRMNTQKGDAEIWRASASTLLSNVSVSATLSRSVLSSLTVVSFIGSNGIGASNGCNAASGAPTCSLTTTATNSWVFGVGNDWNNAIARTLGPNQTMVHYYLTPLNDTYWVQRQTAVTPSSGTVVKINDTAPTGDSYNLVIVEVLAQ